MFGYAPTITDNLIYNAISPSPVAGATVPIQGDSHGNMQMNLNSLLSGEDQVHNVMVNEAATLNAIRNGQCFVAQARNTTASNVIVGLAVFNPVLNAKNILITSIQVSLSASTNALGNSLYLQTVDPALGTLVTPTNLKGGSPASGASCSSSNTVLVPAGTLVKGQSVVATTTVEVLNPQQALLLPSGAANGVTMYVTPSTVVWAIAITYWEYV